MKLRYRYVSYSAGHDALTQMQQMQHLLHHMMNRTHTGTAGAWQPPMDVYETDDALVVRLEMAGVREDDIDITLFADYLEVTGTRRNTGAANAAYHVAGILYGDFRIRIPVLTQVRRDGVEAAYDNGLLTITLPKAVERIQPTAISIQPVTAIEQTAHEE